MLLNYLRYKRLCPGWTTPEREDFTKLIVHYLNASKLFGNYAEFGVWTGNTFATVYKQSRLIYKDSFKSMKFYAFDSFEGFPDLEGDDIYPQFIKGGRTCNEDDFMNNLKKKGVDVSRVEKIKGWFSETLKSSADAYQSIKQDSISFAYIDCDLYESTKDVLVFLKDRIMSGGIIAFDDWFCFAGNPYKGEQKACIEFLEANKDVVLVSYQQFGWHGMSFIYHKINDLELIERLRKYNMVY
ncbi:TylF/MycF family methyltransferase [bacterium]|nr:TylF/MycF family methyltransferase [bacterium]